MVTTQCQPTTPPCLNVSDEIKGLVTERYSQFFATLCGIPAETITEDCLSQEKPWKQHDILARFLPEAGPNLKLLEVGCGFGMNLLSWILKYHYNGFGVEPSSDGFSVSREVAVRLFRENGCNPERIFDAQGENLPFPDGEFEIVYSTNCLEHTLDPMKMLSECLRVLKPGGVMQIVYPNYHGYFDGHYGVFHPPIFIRGMFVWYLEKILGRTDTEFAKTLRTELNMFWTRRAVRELRKDFEFEVLSIGEEVFLERMKSASLDAWAALRKCRPVLDAARKLGLNAFAGRLACLLQGQMPIILTIKKTR